MFDKIWNFRQNLFCIRDNAKNQAAFNLSDLDHTDCDAHSIQLAIKYCVFNTKEIEYILNHVRQILQSIKMAVQKI